MVDDDDADPRGSIPRRPVPLPRLRQWPSAHAVLLLADDEIVDATTSTGARRPGQQLLPFAVDTRDGATICFGGECRACGISVAAGSDPRYDEHCATLRTWLGVAVQQVVAWASLARS